jgi:7,8-dihydropterin-6-yl-methyl-4-(beta-D-ribofuranosyl)aminobenzene 5'-phosphate synthase
MYTLLVLSLALRMAVPASSTGVAPPQPSRITIVADAFSADSSLHQDWGFSALVEYNGKRILFDTGNNSEGFADNARRLGIDLTDLDAVVISHRHGDHTDGLHHLRQGNPRVTIYAPNDEYFGGPTPKAFFRSDPSLPSEMRYFGGAVPDVVPHGSPWRDLNVIQVDSSREIAPGIRVVRNISATRQFGETPELTLVIDTSEGQIVLVGCSHPGIERIIESVAQDGRDVELLVGGLHLVTTEPAEIERLAVALHDGWGIRRIAPGHCTGEFAFAALSRVYGARYHYAGVGSVIDLPS